MEKLTTTPNVYELHFIPTMIYLINPLMLYFLFITYHPPTPIHLAYYHFPPLMCKLNVKKVKF